MKVLEAMEAKKVRMLNYQDFPLICKSESVAHLMATGESLQDPVLFYVVKTRSHKEPWLVVRQEEGNPVEGVVATYFNGKRLKA